MKISAVLFLILFSFSACAQQSENILYKEGKTIKERFNPPSGYVRSEVQSNSFEYYLRNLPLKEYGEKVRYYNGIIKPNIWVYVSVVDMEIGNRNLQQCADAVMRLRGEYLYKNKKYNDIHFNFTNGSRVDYSKWMEGNRIIVDGNKSYWKKQSQPSNSYKSFRKYMDIIFAYAGTLSLEKELISVDIKNIQIGDVFIQGGSPGHAVIVVDLAQNKKGEKVFLLAQSYMPAQDIQILKNPNNLDLSPWYSIDFGEELKTPEWDFKKTDLKRFKD